VLEVGRYEKNNGAVDAAAVLQELLERRVEQRFSIARQAEPVEITVISFEKLFCVFKVHMPELHGFPIAVHARAGNATQVATAGQFENN